MLQHPLLLLAPPPRPAEAPMESEETVRVLRKLCGLQARQAHAQLQDAWRQSYAEAAVC